MPPVRVLSRTTKVIQRSFRKLDLDDRCSVTRQNNRNQPKKTNTLDTRIRMYVRGRKKKKRSPIHSMLHLSRNHKKTNTWLRTFVSTKTGGHRFARTQLRCVPSARGTTFVRNARRKREQRTAIQWRQVTYRHPRRGHVAVTSSASRCAPTSRTSTTPRLPPILPAFFFSSLLLQPTRSFSPPTPAGTFSIPNSVAARRPEHQAHAITTTLLPCYSLLVASRHSP